MPTMTRKKATKATESPEEEIKRLHGQIENRDRQSFPDAMRCGELLLTVIKPKAGHGNYLRWVKDNLRISAKTAQNYVWVYENRERLKSENVTLLSQAYKKRSEWNAMPKEETGDTQTDATETEPVKAPPETFEVTIKGGSDRQAEFNKRIRKLAEIMLVSTEPAEEDSEPDTGEAVYLIVEEAYKARVANG